MGVGHLSPELPAAVAVTVVLGAVLFFLLFRVFAGRPDSFVRVSPDAPTFDPRQGPLKVLVWNIQFCGGTRLHFFYEGGTAVLSTRDDVSTSLEAIASVIERLDPDVVLLQEVDRFSRRSCWIDEHAVLRARLPKYVVDASTWYWRMPWLPVPSDGGTQLGTTYLHLSCFSKFAIDPHVKRVALPAICSDTFIRRVFNLRRAVQCVTLPCADGGPPIVLLHTHLSAFEAKFDGTVQAQIAVLRELMARHEAEGTR